MASPAMPGRPVSGAARPAWRTAHRRAAAPPRPMFLCVLLGGPTVGITIGLLDVLVLRLDAISSQKSVSAGVDLALGLLLLATGALVATGRLHGRRKEPFPAGGGPPDTPGKEKKDSWAERVLAEP